MFIIFLVLNTLFLKCECFLDDAESRKAENLLEVMEQIDDDCAKRGIQFVKVSEEGAAEAFGVARLPSLVFFQNDLPSLYEGMPVEYKSCFLSIFLRTKGLGKY